MWETTSVATKVNYAVIFIVTYALCYGASLLWMLAIDDSETAVFELVASVLGADNTVHATHTSGTIYPKWEDKPFTLLAPRASLSVDSRGMLLTTEWDVHVTRSNKIFPGHEGKAVVTAAYRWPGSQLQSASLCMPGTKAQDVIQLM